MMRVFVRLLLEAPTLSLSHSAEQQGQKRQGRSLRKVPSSTTTTTTRGRNLRTGSLTHETPKGDADPGYRGDLPRRSQSSFSCTMRQGLRGVLRRDAQEQRKRGFLFPQASGNVEKREALGAARPVPRGLLPKATTLHVTSMWTGEGEGEKEPAASCF